jgi:hypothetical protein
VRAINNFNKRLFKVASDKKLWLRVLGEVGGSQIWFIRTREGLKHSIPRLLIVAGFHGEERAGPLALVRWLEEFDPNLYQHVNLSFIPIVNPVGFDLGERYNDKKEKTNCGFCHPEQGDAPSHEGVILIKNSQILKVSARDGFLSLHEDVTSEKYYLYTFERSKEPTQFTYLLRDEIGKFFEVPLDNETVTTDASGGKGVLVQNGIVYRLCDGSFEDWLFHEGTIMAAVTETPGKFKLQRRIDASVALITKFIELSIEHGPKH